MIWIAIAAVGLSVLIVFGVFVAQVRAMHKLRDHEESDDEP